MYIRMYIEVTRAKETLNRGCAQQPAAAHS
jgi:hypothetical protein